MEKIEFPFKHNDIVSYNDVESEYVDVGFGGDNYKVAESPCRTLVRVFRRGKGFRLQLLEEGKHSYTEAFNMSRRTKSSGYISLKQYLDYFGDFKGLEFCTTWEDYNLSEEEFLKKYPEL